MTRLLASVASLDEARLVARAGASIVDLKNPAAGALGALSVEAVEFIVRQLEGDGLISATVGDLPMDPDGVVHAVEAMAATGVDFVKVGFFPGGDGIAVARALRRLAAKTQLIAVCFADGPDLAVSVGDLRDAGFAGVMVDTCVKDGRSLRDHWTSVRLAKFVADARSANLLCGLAGSLSSSDIAPLKVLQPDYLGFRGALCAAGRQSALDMTALAEVAGHFNDRSPLRRSA